ncbi:MAG: hypothetical protein IKQ61_00245 [Spirochaetales bacterium]|nr:hypothetical protein [Spirochaetales bacterium]
MPKYEDLKFIKDKVLNFGNEAMIRKEKGEPLIVDDLPPEIIPESNPALEDLDELMNDIADDLKEGMGYSEAPTPEQDIGSSSDIDIDSMTLDDLDEDKLTDSLADVRLDDMMPDLDGLGNIDDNQWNEIADGSFEDLTNLNLDDEPSEASHNDVNMDDFDIGDMNFDDIDIDSPTPSDTDNDNDNILSDDSNIDLSDNDGTAETDALLAGLGGDSSDDDPANFSLNDIDLNDTPSAESNENNDDLADFHIDDMNFESPSFDNNDLTKNDDIADNADPLAGMDLGDMSGTDDNPDSFDMPDIPSDINLDDNDMNFNIENTLGEDNNDMFNMDNLDSFGSGDNADNSGSEDPFNLDNLGSFDDGDNAGNADDNFGGVDFNNDDTNSLLEGFGDFGSDSDEGGLSFGGDDGGLSFDDLNNDDMDFGSEGESSDDGDSDTGADTDYINEEIPLDSDETAAAQPEQPSEDAGNIVLSQDGNINLTDAQRKQIIMSLSVMPKEAEIKIAKQIVSGSYSDEQLKPLINALVNKEKVVNVLRIYEKVTGDTSLARIRTKKMSGHDFSEQKKSLSYQFKKNILPIISRLALIMIVLLSLILLYVKIIDPTFRASHYYKVGKQNITENKFDNVEPYFEAAYKLQRRYGQVLDYARLYRAAKRYKAAEVKYDNAYSLKPSKPLAMEMADFYREMKDYGTAVRRYEELKSLDDTDQNVLIGLGRTHLDWASADRKHLETAKSIFQDVIDMNDKNKDAVFYMMDIAIREGNDRNVMKYYNYIDKNFETKKVEDRYIDAYLDLADFMLSTRRYDEMGDILEKTAKNPKTRTMPRQEYTLSKLKKALNVNDEERIHLNNVIKLFDYMKTANPLEYNTKESMSLLSDTYNALGENADRFSRGSIEAEQNFIKATQYNPLNGKAFYNLGNYELNYKATKNALENAKNNLRTAEKLGYTNDRLNFNLGWIAYKQQDYRESFRRLNPLSNRYTDNSNLKLFLGTVYYKMGNYDYAEAYLKENFDHFINLKQIHYPLDMELNEDRQIAEMLVNCANNLGAVYHKKYQQTRRTNNRDMATKCYEDSMEYYDKLKESKEMFLYEVQGAKTADAREVKLRQLQVTYAHQNLRNILYPAGSSYEPIIFEEFPLQYESSM